MTTQKKFLDELIPVGMDVEIVSGTAKGADRLGERYAKERGFTVTRFKPNWVKHKRGAGFVRNKEMAEYADGLVAFWDGRSKGTAMMIELAKRRNLIVHVISVKVSQQRSMF